MAENKNIYPNIPKEKFQLVNIGERLSDKKFDDKPIGYFRDAFNRFCKSKASVVAAIIIIAIILYAFICPLVSTMDHTFMDSYYAKKGPRNVWLRENLNIVTGGVSRDFSDKGLVKAIAVGVAAEDVDGLGNVTLAEGYQSEYQPMLATGTPITSLNAKKQETRTYTDAKIDTYLEVGFIYKSVKQDEYRNIVAWQEETGIQVLYPLVADNEWNPDASNANNWYKVNKKSQPVTLSNTGKAVVIELPEDMTTSDIVLEENYERDENGNLRYYKNTGGGSFETSQYKIRVLYYNYYRYANGFEPNYILGTDSQGYDMAQRVAGGIKLSLLIAVATCFINFILGAMYGAVEGYYGGWLDIILERVSDILSNVPFIVVATLFQIHLAAKVGPLPSLIFAYVVTGWIGTAYRVRTQFYRFKNQEYVMAARTLGARDRRIIWKHIFPNTLGTIITSTALAIPSAVLTESNLSFLGIVKLGTAESTSLGTLLSEAQGIWTNAPHLMIVPAIFISLLMISFNLFGNGLRDAFNPSLRGVEE